MDLALKILEWTAGLAGFAWFIWWRLQKDEAGPWGFIIKLSASLIIGYIFIRYGIGWFIQGGFAAIFGLGVAMSSALAMGVIWRDDLLGAIAHPFASFYEDKTELEPKPYYAHVEAKRMAGDIPGAVVAVREQLEKFPSDFDGRMRLAALLAEDSEDLPGALAVIEDTLQLPGIEPGQISYALNTAADWHLKFARDAESARLAVERITTLAAGTNAALRAQQRLANFTTQETIEREDNRREIVIPESDRKLGLKRKKFAAPEKLDINAEEARLRGRLAKNANDWTAREELARLYVEQFEFYERGLQELEILITTPRQPQREVVRWLHQRADWQVKLFNDVEGGRATLKRIQTLYPKTAAAERASIAMVHLQPISKFTKKKAEE